MNKLMLLAALAIGTLATTGCDSVTVVERHRDYRSHGYYGGRYYGRTAYHAPAYRSGYVYSRPAPAYRSGYAYGRSYRRPSSATIVVTPSHRHHRHHR